MDKDKLKEKVLGCVDEFTLLQLLRSMIRIPSFLGDETECARYLAKWMVERGIETELMEVEEGRLQPVGRIRGTGEGPVLVYNGHMDIDAWFEGPKNDPFEMKIVDIEGEKRVFGQGLANMKGGVACFLIAGDAIKRAATKYKIEFKGDLVLTPVVGETQGGIGTRTLLKTWFPKHGLWPDMAVVPEPYGHAVITVHPGNVGIQINVYGVAQHTSRAEEDAVDAIKKMMNVINAIRRELGVGEGMTYTPSPKIPRAPRFLLSTLVCGRRRVMTTPPSYYFDLRSGAYSSDLAILVIDVRTTFGQTPELVKEDFERVLRRLKKEDPELEYEVKTPVDKKFETHRCPINPLDVPVDEYIVQSVRKAYRYFWGKEPNPMGGEMPGYLAYNDTGHFWEAGIPCLLHGPEPKVAMMPEPYAGMIWRSGGSSVVDRAHKPGTYATIPGHMYITVDELVGCSKVLTLTALDVLTKTKEEVNERG